MPNDYRKGSICREDICKNRVEYTQASGKDEGLY